MSYSGEVEVGGPPAVRETGELRVTKIAVGPMANNAYLLTCLRTGAQVLIDAADEADRLIREIGDGGLTHIITTHQHADHWQALAKVARATGAEIVVGEDDADGLPIDATIRVRDKAIIPVGESVLEVIEIRGHTPGSIVLAYEDSSGRAHLFTGDSLFPGGVGRTWAPDDFLSLMHDVETKLFARFDDYTWFYPGHGNDSTLGVERQHLDQWRARGW